MINKFVRFGNSLENHTRFQIKMGKVYGEFSHDVTVAITMKRRPYWSPKPVRWELNSFLMQTLSFVPMNLHRGWPREWKHSMPVFRPKRHKNHTSWDSTYLFSLYKGVPTWSGSHDISRLISIKGLFERIWEENQYLILIIWMECL